MTEKHIIINKTARYYTLGSLNERTKQVWFVLHGHGQLAGNFIKKFEPLLSDDVFFIAPEALNHFYLKRGSMDVGATWMTKEDRLNEIKDYINYLNDLYVFDLKKEEWIKLKANCNIPLTSSNANTASNTSCPAKDMAYYLNGRCEQLPGKKSRST